MVSSHMVLLPASSRVFLLSLDKNDSMDCCRFIVSGEQQMRNDTNARVCAPARRNVEKPAEKIPSPVLRSTSQQLNKVLRDKRCVYFLFFHIFIHLLMRSGSQLAYFLKQLI